MRHVPANLGVTFRRYGANDAVAPPKINRGLFRSFFQIIPTGQGIEP
jgi:hypothetical protein